MKILLLSDIPPCDNLTAGLVLSAMVRLVPRDEICCFIVANPMLDIHLTPEFANIPMQIHAKPNENWAWLPRQRFIGKISSVVAFAAEGMTELTAVRALIDKAVKFGREQKVDRVWAVLQGQTTIRMAQAVADRLGVPLHTQVWDPFSWWAKANNIDGMTRHRVQSMFDNAVRRSRFVATASEPMAKLYGDRFGAAAVPVISSHPIAMAQAPDLATDDKAPIVIGMAGQFYAAAEWLQFLGAMQNARWRLAGRHVRIVVLGPQPPPGAVDRHVSFLGWKSQPNAAFILSRCDMLYCPYPFDSAMREVSQYSFPSKLVLYLAAGRPTVFHGPGDSSPARYIESRQCGVIADRLSDTAIYEQLERLAGDPATYRTMGKNAQAAFRHDFTLGSMARSFNTFIGGSAEIETGEPRLHDHSLHDRAAPALPASSAAPISGATVRTFIARRGGTRRRLRSLARRAFEILHPRNSSEEVGKLHAKVKPLPPGEVMAPTSSSLSSDPFPGLYPGIKVLVMAALTDAVEANSEGGLRPAGGHRPTATVGYVDLPPAIGEFELHPNWQAAASPAQLTAIESMLRLILEEGFERIVVSSQRPGDIAMAALVARLASLRLTVVARDTSPPADWVSAADDIDILNVSPAAPNLDEDG